MTAKSETLMLLFFSALLSKTVVAADQPGSNPEKEERAIDLAIADAEPDNTILFPWFAEALGIIIFFVSKKSVLA